MSDNTNSAEEYRVLARKYRPATFSELIGQDAMVRTLSNAIAAGRLAHAFIMTGVRGIGKTSTARMLAKALNCVGADGNGGVTVDPCGVCENCKAIAESRHVDVLEMDAASRTGVDDVREIIESVRYAPVSARFKVYIIDEVHMLSKSAFNALLKTLEEPPPHVKFIFATTEIRKLPVTVLSRCQRFDLRRVGQDDLVTHFGNISEKEGASVDEGALKMMARAAEGSVRDGLSLLDQAIAHGGGTVSEEQVREMLGLADRTRILELMELVMKGEVATALAALREQYDLGTDPQVVINDLLETTHWITRLKVTPDAGVDALVSEDERGRGLELANSVGMPALARAWQMLLKGLGEVQLASQPLAAAEMVLVRLCYAQDLPNPADLVAKLKDVKAMPAPAPQTTAAPAPTPAASAAAEPASGSIDQSQHMDQHMDMGQPAPPPHEEALDNDAPTSEGSSAPMAVEGNTVLALRPGDNADSPSAPMPLTFRAMVELCEDNREGQLGYHLRDDVHLISFRPGAVSLRPLKHVPPTFASRLRHCLETWTGNRWMVSLSDSEEGDATLSEQDTLRAAELKAEAATDPIVAKVLSTFEGAEIIKVLETKFDVPEFDS